MTNQNVQDKFKVACDKFEEHFNGSLHNILWQVMVEQKFGTKTIAFCDNIMSGETVLGISVANEAGYCPTYLSFKEHNHNIIARVVEEMNEMVLGLNGAVAEQIVFSSMFPAK